MNDQDQPGSGPDFDDPAYDDVRALLADARATGPIPDDVIARLDTTLAALTADRRATGPGDQDVPAVVVPLRRRSRTGSRLLAAAAAVIVVGAGGVGLAEVLRSSGSGDDQLTADSATVATPESADAGSPPELAPASPVTPGNSLSIPEGDLGRMAARASRSLPQFTSTGFPAEATAFRRTYLVALAGGLQSGYVDSSGPKAAGGATGADGAGSGPQPGTTAEESSKDLDQLGSRYSNYAKAACPGPKGITAAVVPIRYDGKPAALAIHPATPSGRLYAAWSCDGATLLAWTVVPR